jgi:hypothetical protein
MQRSCRLRIVWLEMARDGLLYVLTHRSSDGTLIDEVLQIPRALKTTGPLFDFRKAAMLQLRSSQIANCEVGIHRNGHGDVAPPRAESPTSAMAAVRRLRTSQIGKFQRQMSLNGSGDMAVYRTVLVIEACPR